MQISNAAIARLLFRLANLLEISGEPEFKVRAYRGAAEQIANHPEQVVDYFSAGTPLTIIPRIGAGIEKQIHGLLTDGYLQRYEELRATVPEELIELLSIRGLGATRVRTLHRDLNITGIVDLQEALEAGRLRQAKGFTPRTEDRIRRSLYEFLAHRGRTLRALTEPIAEDIVATLETLPGTAQAVPAGCYRRGLETVGTLHVVVSSTGPDEVRGALSAWKHFHGWLTREDSALGFLTEADLQVAVHLVSPEGFGAALHRLTGSAEYIAALTGDKSPAAQHLNAMSEADYCTAIDVPCLPPELRSGTEALAEMRRSGLPELVTAESIRGDLHMHTTHTDGRDTVEEMAVACRERGYQYLAITDHTRNVRIAGGLHPEQVPAYLEAIEKANERVSGITILKGLEVDILADGTMDMPDEIMAELDVVIGAIHSHFDQDTETVTERVIAAMEHPLVQFIAHPSGRLVGQRSPLLLDFSRLFDAAQRTGTMFELNANPERLDLHDKHCRMARLKGIPVAINTDAHTVGQLSNMKCGVLQARRGMLSAEHVLNSYPLTAMRELLNRKRKRL